MTRRLRHMLVGLVLAGILLLPLLLLGHTDAASMTWDGGGLTNNWSDCDNWSGDVCPGAGDSVTFDGTSTKDSLIDYSFGGNITDLAINSGYTGTISQQQGLIVPGTFSQDDGTFNAGSQTLNINTFTLSGGNFTASSRTTSFNGDVTISGSPTFDANGGTVILNGSGTINCNHVVFNQVKLEPGGSGIAINGDCSLPLGNNPTFGNGGSENNMNGSAPTGFGSGGGGAGFYGGMGGNGLYGGGGGGAAGYTATDRVGGVGGGGTAVFSPVGGTDEVRTSGSSYTVPAGVTSIKVWAIGAGGGGAGATGSDSTSGGAGGAGGVAYKTFTVIPGEIINYSLGAGGAGGIDTNNGSSGSDTTVTDGIATINGGGGGGGEYNTGNPAAGGSFSGGDGGMTGGTGSGASGDNGGGGGGGIGGGNAVQTDSDSGDNGGQGIDVSGLFPLLAGLGYATSGPGTGGTSIDGSDCSLDLFGTITGSGTLTGNCTGTFWVENGSSLSGFNGLVNAGVFDVFGSTYDLSAYSAFSVHGLAIDGAGSLVLPSSGATVTGDFVLNAGGNLTMPAGTAYFNTGFYNYGGTINANGGTVNLNGTDQVIQGDTTFYNLTKTVSSAYTLAFGAGSTTTVLGRLTLSGVGGGLLSLVSDSPGSPWFINSLGTTNVNYVNVSDSDATGGKTIVACKSVDSGGNSGWMFNTDACTPPPPAPIAPTTGGSNPTAAITNYQLLQAYLANQSAQYQAGAAPTITDNSGLPGKIRQFIKEFPSSQPLLRAFGEFLLTLLIGLILGILLVLWLIWRRRRRHQEPPAPPSQFPPSPTPWQPPSIPTAFNPPPPAGHLPSAGTTIQPTVFPNQIPGTF